MNEQEKALDILNSLKLYNYKEREIKLDDVKIIIAPLSASEVVNAFEESSKLDDVDASITMLKIQVVARSIITVNDIKLPPTGMIDKKIEIVSSLSDELVDYLFDQYCVFDRYLKTIVENRDLQVSNIDEVK